MAYNTFSQACILYENTDVHRTVENAGDVDWFKVKFSKTGNANFYLEPQQSDLQLDLRLYDSNSNLLRASLNKTGVHELITYPVRTNVYYYVRINHSGYYSKSHQYIFRCKNYPTTDRTYSKTVSVNNYKQCGQSWSSHRTSCGGSMCYEGCTISCGAMIFKVSPTTHLEELKVSGGADCPYQWSTAARKHGKSHTQKLGSFDSLKATMFNYIYNKNTPVIARVSGSTTHFIVVKGVNAELPMVNGSPDLSKLTTSMFIVNDPGSNSNQTIADVLNKYPSFTRIDVFY